MPPDQVRGQAFFRSCSLYRKSFGDGFQTSFDVLAVQSRSGIL
jgi:hypothetical protein